MISDPREDAAQAAVEDAAIAALRDWLTSHCGKATPTTLAHHYGLSLVCVRDLIQGERRRRRRLANRPAPDAVVPEPDPRTVGEGAFLAHVTAFRVDPEADTVHSLALRFRLSEVYVKARLAEHGVRLPVARRRGSQTSTGTR